MEREIGRQRCWTNLSRKRFRRSTPYSSRDLTVNSKRRSCPVRCLKGWTLHQHGLVKGAMMLLGLPHHHEGDDLVVSAGWEALLEGLGFSFDGDRPLRTKTLSTSQLSESMRCAKPRRCWTRSALEKAFWKRARHHSYCSRNRCSPHGLGIAETDQVGRDAAASVPTRSRDPAAYLAAQRLEDEHAVEGIMVLVRSLSDLRWEHSAPVRVGCRMGRPEKAAPRS